LKVIACVGETFKQRGAGSTMSVVAEQTKAIAGTDILFHEYLQIYL
jgi:triosephosphate isomerase